MKFLDALIVNFALRILQNGSRYLTGRKLWAYGSFKPTRNRLCLLLASFFIAQGAWAQNPTMPCDDEFEIMYAVKPEGFSYWLYPTTPFVSALPVTHEAKAEGVTLTVNLKRVNTTDLIAEFTMGVQATNHLDAALYLIKMDVNNPKAFSGELAATKSAGGGSPRQPGAHVWSISLKPTCQKL